MMHWTIFPKITFIRPIYCVGFAISSESGFSNCRGAFCHQRSMMNDGGLTWGIILKQHILGLRVSHRKMPREVRSICHTKIDCFLQ